MCIIRYSYTPILGAVLIDILVRRLEKKLGTLRYVGPQWDDDGQNVFKYMYSKEILYFISRMNLT